MTTTQYHVRLDTQIAERVQLIANIEHVAQNAMIAQLVAEALDAREHGLRPAIDLPEPPMTKKELAATIAGVMNDQRRLMRDDITNLMQPIYREASGARRFAYRIIEHMATTGDELIDPEGDLAQVRQALKEAKTHL